MCLQVVQKFQSASWQVGFIKQNNAVCILANSQAVVDLGRSVVHWHLVPSKTKSASLRAFFERSTPICSTISSVSTNTSCINQFERNTVDVDVFFDDISSSTSNICNDSLVLHARRLLRRLDFPTLGQPMMVVEIPSRSILPRRAVLRRLVSNFSNSIVFSRGQQR